MNQLYKSRINLDESLRDLRVSEYKREVDEYWKKEYEVLDFLSQNFLLPELSKLIKDYYQHQSVEDVSSYGYINTNGTKEGLWISWRRHSGSKITTGKYYNNLKEGHWTSHSAGGILIRDCRYSQGLLDGPEICYYEISGKKHIETEWTQGKKNGIEIKWDREGFMREKRNYLNEELEGEQFTFRSDGRIKLVKTYILGIRIDPL